jgi:NAD(P)-dependent dehydrogenase (short-subunit alcohol dehydrogenase family)
MSLERTQPPLVLRAANKRAIVTSVPTASARQSRSCLLRTARTGCAWLCNLSIYLGGHFNFAQAVLPHMLQQGTASVVNIASMYRRSFGAGLGKDLYRPCQIPDATRERAEPFVTACKNHSS